MLDWLKKLFRRLTQSDTSGRPQFPTEKIQLEEAIQRAVKESSVIWPQAAKLFVAQTATRGAKAGLYTENSREDSLAYVWHILSENRVSWPNLSKAHYGALHLAVTACVRTRAVPSYWANPRLPDASIESEIDQFIRDLAQWCYTEWLTMLWKKWNAITARYGEQLESAEFPESPVMRKILLQEGVCAVLHADWYVHLLNESFLLEQMITLWSYKNTGKWEC